MEVEPCEARYRDSDPMRALFPILVFLRCLMQLSMNAEANAVIARRVCAPLMVGTAISADVRMDRV